MKKSSIIMLFIATAVLFLAVITVGIVETKQNSTIKKIETACGGNGIWLMDSATGKSTYVSPTTYVESEFDVAEKAETSYGIEYSKEGQMTLLDVDCDVKEAFEEAFASCKHLLQEGETLYTENGNGKYQLDLWTANKLVLLAAGVTPEHIQITDICTCCNPEYLHSHRASSGKRGLLGAFLVLTQ